MLTGIEIKMLRKKKGYSQEQLAAIVGVTRSSVYAWEKGTYLPEGKNAVALAYALDIDPHLLLPLNVNDQQNTHGRRSTRRFYEMKEDGSLVPVETPSLERLLQENPDLEIWFREQAATEEGRARIVELLNEALSRWGEETDKEEPVSES
jgi:DNA-binding XRE family transcriptional regulator